MLDIFNMTGNTGSMFLYVDSKSYEVETVFLNEITLSTDGLGWSTNVRVKVVNGVGMAGTEFVCRVSWNVGGDRPACENIEQEIAACIASRILAKETYDRLDELSMEFDVYGEI